MKNEKKEQSGSRVQLERIAARSSARFRHVILPFDARDFANCLLKLGYGLVQPLPPQPPSGPPSIPLSAAGHIASKGEFQVDINTDRQFFGVAGGDPSSNFEQLWTLLEILRTERLTTLKNVHFFELQARYKAPAKNVVDSMIRLGAKSEIVARATESFKKDMGLFSARLTAGNASIDSPDYFEVYVQPTIARPRSEIGVSIIFRTPKAKAFRAFASSVESRLSDFISSILHE